MDTGFCTTEGHEAKPQHGKSGLCQACYRKKRRTEARGDEPKQKPGPKPDPTKPYSRLNPNGRHYSSGSKSCLSGHEWTEGSYKLRSDGKKVCLVCIEERKGENCPAGLHLRAEHENTYGACRECRRLGKREKDLAYKYNLTLEQFEGMVQAQEEKCFLCGEDLDFETHNGVCVDHDHVTGKTRKILCGHCNRGLGGFKDRPGVLRLAADYVESYT